MKVIVTATAPTAYQLSSLLAFKFEVKSNANGSFTATKKFNTKWDARNNLIDRAYTYYDDRKEYLEAKKDIIKHDLLKIDAVTAYIEKDNG